eukprot:gene6920-8256_t
MVGGVAKLGSGEQLGGLEVEVWEVLGASEALGAGALLAREVLAEMGRVESRAMGDPLGGLVVEVIDEEREVAAAVSSHGAETASQCDFVAASPLSSALAPANEEPEAVMESLAMPLTPSAVALAQRVVEAERQRDKALEEAHVRAEAARAAITQLQQERDAALEEAQATKANVVALKEEEEAKYKRVLEDTEAIQVKLEQRVTRQHAALTEMVVAKARLERIVSRQEMESASGRLGRMSMQRIGLSSQVAEVWEDGAAFVSLGERLRAVAENREATDTLRKGLKRRPQAQSTSAPSPSSSSSMPSSSASAASTLMPPPPPQVPMSPEDVQQREEVYRARLQALKNEELLLMKEKERLQMEKAKHVSELRRMREEGASQFNKHMVLADRYVLTHLLGRGGFSEVFKAYDTVELREVACKIHQLNTQWSEAKKQNYVKHTVREYNIHKALQHPNIVQLYDVFELDANTFCTILEYCEGGDLDSYLKTNRILGEREARIMMMQVLAGLDYVADPERRVIHYDLKPVLGAACGGRYVFEGSGHTARAQVIEEQGADCLELTSQGAGTYWYLPPECFEVGNRPPQISNKVDVWSAGVIFYQMLYGHRPFGHNLSQEKILREEVIIRANKVEFPAKPVVSNEVKEFIQLCLTHRQADRPDVRAAANDPYISGVRMKK